MVSGHSDMERDVDHALIEKQKKKLPFEISHPRDWYQLVRSIGGKTRVVNKLMHDVFFYFNASKK